MIWLKWSDSKSIEASYNFLYIQFRLKFYIWKFELDNEKYVIKIKENEGSPNIQVIINNQTYKKQGSIKHKFDIKGHEFIFLKPENETIYKLYIDSLCFDDLIPNNKKQKGNKLEKPIKNKDSKTMVKKKKKKIENKNDKGKTKNIDDFSGTGSDIYIQKKEKEVEKYEDDIPEYDYLIEKIINTDDIPEYDYLSQKIINADSFRLINSQ